MKSGCSDIIHSKLVHASEYWPIFTKSIPMLCIILILMLLWVLGTYKSKYLNLEVPHTFIDIRYANPNLSLWHWFYLIKCHSIEFYRLCILTKFEVNISHVYLKNTITNCITRAAFYQHMSDVLFINTKITFNLPALLNIRFFVITCKNHPYI